MLEKLRRLLEPVKSISTDEADEKMKELSEGEFTLLDVRQPSEYEQGHLPGAKLIPLPQLSDSVDQVDKNKPVFVYCAVGGRSRVAAHMLAGHDFPAVYNVKGGIKAWEGPVADGPVESNLHLVRGDESPEEIIKLAYGMEDGLGRFYRTMADDTDDQTVKDLLQKLASIEDRHKDYLVDMYERLEGSPSDLRELEGSERSTPIEGGFDPNEFIERNRSFMQTRTGLLDISMMLEAQALDLYLRFAGKVGDSKAKEILFKLADEEKGHLAQLGELRENLT